MEKILQILAFCFLALVLWLQNITSAYKHFAPHISVDDLAFSFIPMIDFSWLYFGEIWILLFWGFFAFRASKIPLSFIVFSFAVLFCIRSLVLIPTGIGTPMNQIIPHGFGFGFGVVHYLQNDMFFSGHTASPALLIFLFWEIVWARIVFIVFTAVMAYAVLSMRIHYSIDVIGAVMAAHASFYLAHFLYGYLLRFIDFLRIKYAEHKRKSPPMSTEEKGPVCGTHEG